jgi:hypothetical protein
VPTRSYGQFCGLARAPDGRRPDTVLEAEPEAVLGLAGGALTIGETLSLASVHGDPHVITRVLAGAHT